MVVVAAYPVVMGDDVCVGNGTHNWVKVRVRVQSLVWGRFEGHVPFRFVALLIRTQNPSRPLTVIPPLKIKDDYDCFCNN